MLPLQPGADRPPAVAIIAFLLAAVAFAWNVHSKTRSGHQLSATPKARPRRGALLPLWRILREGLLDNPVITKEVRETFGARRAAVIFSLFLAALGLTVFIAWPRGAQLLQNIDQVSRRLFTVVAEAMLVLVAVFAPSFSAVAITGEKERRCFELLVTSGLSERKVLFGKVVGSLLFLGVLIVCSAPMVSICLFLGGISPFEVLGLYLLLFETALAFGVAGLLFSALFERNNAALGVTYAVVLPAVALILYWGRGGALVQPAFGILPILLLGTLAVLEVLALRIRRPPEIKPMEEESDEYLRQAAGLVLNRELIPDRWLAPPRRTDLMPDGTNPVLDKEVRNEFVGQGTLMLRVIIQIGLALTLIPFTMLYLFGQPAWYFVYLAAFSMLIAPAFACGLFTGEHENRTFSLLVTTLLTPRQIVAGKLTATARLVLLLLGILIVPSTVAIGYAHAAYIDNMSLPRAFLCYAVCLLWALLLVVLSLTWSMISRRTTAALVGTYLTAIALFAGPLVVHQVIISFPLLPDAWAPFLLPLSPMTHLFGLAPGSIAATMIPPTLLGDGLAVPRAWIYLAGLLAASLGLTLLMIRAYEWTWRRWRAMGEA